MSTTKVVFSRRSWILQLLICQIWSVKGFHSTVVFNNNVQKQQQRSSSQLAMISFGGGGGGGGSNAMDPPRDVKEAVKRCQDATQEALKNRMSRMDIEFPVGTKFGVEKTPKVKGGNAGAGANPAPTQGIIQQSDRELARLFVEMFQPVGGENIVVAFTDQNQADLAKKKWKGEGAISRIMAMNRRKGGPGGGKNKKGKKSKPKGFAAKLAVEVGDSDSAGAGGPFELPKGTEVALFVAPGPKELVIIEKICNEVGMGTLVVLLNARLSKVSNFGTDTAEKLFLDDFEPVFALTAAPQDAAPDCLLYRSYPDDWVMARKPKVGQPKAVLTQKDRPTSDVCKEAYDNIEVGDFEKGFEDALDNVVGWFR